ncbi:hypothetical protein LTR85_011704 [Meristemomyces frigidus]|nr:hypothetical protein LTR85_011704 [Meristemomyces frigidus]
MPEVLEPHQQPAPPRLLALPPELRNKIYEYVLIDNAGVVVVTQATVQPPLLRTCTKVRSQALPIWYADNEFEVKIRDCDGSIYVKWLRHTRSIGSKGALRRVAWILSGRPNWTNLMAWLREQYEGRSDLQPEFSFSGNVELPDEWRFVIAAHDMLKDYSEKPWHVFERAMKRLRYAVDPFDPRWRDGVDSDA